MDLEFSLPEIFAVVASVYILFQISGDGETNWIEGRAVALGLPDPRDPVFLFCPRGGALTCRRRKSGRWRADGNSRFA